jgi:hypothetical protein
MDPASALASAAVAFLSPYLTRAGEKTAERIGEKIPDAAGKMWQTIIGKFNGHPAAEEAVRDLAAQTEDEDNLAAFHEVLRKTLVEDPAFASELRELLQQAQSQAGDTILSTGSGTAATRGGVAAGEGGVAVQGDVHGGINLGRTQTP